MKVVFYSTQKYDRLHFDKINNKGNFQFNIKYYDFPLTLKTAKNATGADAVCLFVNDDASHAVITELAKLKVQILALRCSGFNNVNLPAAKELGIKVVRVPAYSPEAVAEYTVGLMLCLNRKIHCAYQRTKNANFSLEGFTGFNMSNRTAGIIGTGKIGLATLRILKGFGMKLLTYDKYPNKETFKLGANYVDLDTLLNQSDIISLHCPLNAETYHLLNETAFNQMKTGVMVINTSRGGLIDSNAAIEALKQQKISYLGMDVYENESKLFLSNKAKNIIVDEVFRKLSNFKNVLLTGHQAFLTEEALNKISETTLQNLQQIRQGQICPNIITG